MFSEQCNAVAIARNTADVGVQRIAFNPLTLAVKVPYLVQIQYDTIHAGFNVRSKAT